MTGERTATSQRTELAALTGQPASFWVASLACLAMIIGGVAQWATAFAFISVSGTSMHGWNEVAAGIAGLAMLGVRLLRDVRLPLVLAALAGVLGAIQAVATLAKIGSDGAMTVLGVQYRYLEPAWGLYLVLVAAIVLACSATLTWRAVRVTE
jgi:cytochrome b subunit of formate dehydrogenase